jgi:hypothetical protein
VQEFDLSDSYIANKGLSVLVAFEMDGLVVLGNMLDILRTLDVVEASSMDIVVEEDNHPFDIVRQQPTSQPTSLDVSEMSHQMNHLMNPVPNHLMS